jgi:hypothetical protein
VPGRAGRWTPSAGQPLARRAQPLVEAPLHAVEGDLGGVERAALAVAGRRRLQRREPGARLVDAAGEVEDVHALAAEPGDQRVRGRGGDQRQRAIDVAERDVVGGRGGRQRGGLLVADGEPAPLGRVGDEARGAIEVGERDEAQVVAAVIVGAGPQQVAEAPVDGEAETRRRRQAGPGLALEHGLADLVVVGLDEARPAAAHHAHQLGGAQLVEQDQAAADVDAGGAGEQLLLGGDADHAYPGAVGPGGSGEAGPGVSGRSSLAGRRPRCRGRRRRRRSSR